MSAFIIHFEIVSSEIIHLVFINFIDVINVYTSDGLRSVQMGEK